MKDLSIGGIVMLNRTDKGDKDEEIVEPMEVGLSMYAFCFILRFQNSWREVSRISFCFHLQIFVQVNKASTGSEEEGDEPAPPEPFEWKEEED